MKPNRFAAGVVLTATLANASWAQVSTDTKRRPSQAATPMTHLAIGTVKGIDAAGRSVTIATWRGLRAPWVPLLDWCPDLQLAERYHWGTGYLAVGTVRSR